MAKSWKICSPAQEIDIVAVVCVIKTVWLDPFQRIDVQINVLQWLSVKLSSEVI